MMLAMLVGVVDQVTWLVTSPVELLPKVAVAVNCCVTLGATVEFAGKIWSEVMVVDDGKNWPQLVENASAQRGTNITRDKDFLDTQSIVPLARCMTKSRNNKHSRRQNSRMWQDVSLRRCSFIGPTAEGGKGMVPGGDLNPHNPFGSAGFKP